MESGSIESLIDELRSDRSSGATELALRSLDALVDLADGFGGGEPQEFRRQITALAEGLRAARASMVVIENLQTRWLSGFGAASESELEGLRREALSLAKGLREELVAAQAGAVANMAALVAPGEVVMTHSLSSTIKSLFANLKDKRVRAIITESRPLEEGRLLAAHLSGLGIETRYITDAQMGLWVSRANRVVVGADSVLRDGSVVNKAGTVLLALAANHVGIPVNVCCETFKYSNKGPAEIQLEEMAPAELELEPLPHVTVANSYFDITPARCISAWVSERGSTADWS